MTRRISVEEFNAMKAKPQNSAARAVTQRGTKVEVDGFKFDSKPEARFYTEKKLRLGKQVRNLIVKPGFDLGVCYYKSDFSFEELLPDVGWNYVVVEIKGYCVRDAKQALTMKMKLMERLYGIEVRIITQETNPSLFRR